MIGPAKERKLSILFGTVPEGMLRGLHRQLDTGDGGPLDETLLRLVSEAAERRGVALADEEPPAAEEPAETGSDDEADADIGFGEFPVAEEDTPEEDEAGEDDADEPLVLAPEMARAPESATEAPVAEESGEDETVWEPPAFVPPRNAMHAFFLPFESLIIDPPRYAGRVDGYLCSTSLPGIWRMLNDEASGAVIRDAWLKVELEREVQSEDYYRQITGEMHAAARVVVDEIATRATEDKGARRALLARLGSEAALGDFLELHRMLPQILSFQSEFNRLRPLVARYNGDRAGEIAGRIAERTAARPVLARYLQFAVLSNLDSPWQGLWLHRALADIETGVDTRAPAPVIAGHLIEILELQSAWLQSRLRAGQEDAALLDPFIGFSQLLGGMIDQRDTIDDPGRRDRLDSLRDNACEMFDQLMETAAGALETMLPTRTTDADEEAPDLGWFGRAENVDDLVEAGHDAAQFLKAGQTMAPLYERDEVWAGLHEETVAIVERYVSKVAAMLADIAAGASDRKVGNADYLLPVAEILADRATVEPLRRALSSEAGVA